VAGRYMMPGGSTKALGVDIGAGFREGKVTHEHVYWDQASVLVQVGLLDPAGLPVTGAGQAEKLLAPRSVPVNSLLNPRSPGHGSRPGSVTGRQIRPQ